MKKKILFIVNPISGAAKHHAIETLIDKTLNKAIFDYELAYTNAPKHAIELSRQGVQESFETIVAVGGDGSVNEVGRSLIGTNSTLAILPCGSGNGTARHLGIPRNLVKAIDVINQNNTTTIDTFRVNNEIAVNVAGIGFAAHISHEFSKLKNRGFRNYIKLAVRDSLNYRSQFCEIEIKNPSPDVSIGTSPGHSPQGEGGAPTLQKLKLKAFIIDIANGTQWGNNAALAPQAKSNDGVLDLCVVRTFPLINFPVMAVRLFTNSFHRSKYVNTIQMQETIIRQENTYAHIDGEPIITGNELRVKINPLSLKVIVPSFDFAQGDPV